MDMELYLSERTVDETISDFLKARITVRPNYWMNDFPTIGMRTLNATIFNIEEIEQRRLQLYKGKIYKDSNTGRMFAVDHGTTDTISLITTNEKK
jgi:hypothetical protein